MLVVKSIEEVSSKKGGEMYEYTIMDIIRVSRGCSCKCY